MAGIIISGFILIILLQCLAVVFHTMYGVLNKKILNGIILYYSYIFIVICEILSICILKYFECFFIIFFVVMSFSLFLRNFIFNSLFIRLLFFVSISLPAFEIEKFLFGVINIIYLFSCIFVLLFDFIKKNYFCIKNIYRKFLFSFINIYNSVICGMILYIFGYDIASYIVVIIISPLILEHSRIFDIIFSHNVHPSFRKEKKQEERGKDKQEEFRKLWFRLCQESQGKVFETLLKQAFQVARGNDRRVIAKSFYGLVLQWVHRTPFEGQFREAWRGVLRKHVQGGKVFFSWDCLISLSRLVMGFAVLCAEYHAEQTQSQKRNGQKKSSRQEHYQRHGNRRQARRSARVSRPWYVVLSVSETASVEEIKKAYRKKIIENHPDRFAHQGEEKRLEAEEMSKEINEAFQYIRKYKCF